MKTGPLLRRVTLGELSDFRHNPIDAATLAKASDILDRVRLGGEHAVRAYATSFHEVAAESPLIIGRDALDAALASLAPEDRALLQRVHARITGFAQAQRASLRELEHPVPGGAAGHRIMPVARAGCYAPGGRFPLPSTVLMTVATARAAGVASVIVASPKPTAMTLAAAAVAGADALLSIGGAHAIAAMAYGTLAPPCDVIVGPGNRWVTAAKKLLCGQVGIDMLAGPSELVVLADDSADPATVAADLLAQAEHDTDALPILVTDSAALLDAVNFELARQLADLPTRETAEAALGNGFAVLTEGIDESVAACNMLAPEHLEVICRDEESVAARLIAFGGLFIGGSAAEVLGDYGAGPNHTLPTSGTARFSSGLSVLAFLRFSTWLRIDDPAAAQGLVRDAVALGRHEGLEGHARSAERRLL